MSTFGLAFLIVCSILAICPVINCTLAILKSIFRVMIVMRVRAFSETLFIAMFSDKERGAKLNLECAFVMEIFSNYFCKLARLYDA